MNSFCYRRNIKTYKTIHIARRHLLQPMESRLFFQEFQELCYEGNILNYFLPYSLLLLPQRTILLFSDTDHL